MREHPRQEDKPLPVVKPSSDIKFEGDCQMTPSWFEHVDLMNYLIGLLCLLVGWFIKREFKNFENKLNKVCDGLDKKVKQDEFDKFKQIMYYQLHEHDHQIECNAADCKPKTTGVIIRERRS